MTSRQMSKLVSRITALFAAAAAAFTAIRPIAAFAQDESALAQYKGTVLSAGGFWESYLLNDGSQRTFTSTQSGSITLQNDSGISSLYIVFNKIPEPWTLSVGESSACCGENRFLHEFVDVKSLFGEPVQELTLSFEKSTSIAEVYAFTEGELPEWVQKWEPACEKADLLLFSSHADDEHLFFAGMLPYYAGELGLNVQVVYLTNHFDTYYRPHEQLDGLWKVGVTSYPVISDFPDLYSESYDGAVAVYAYSGYSFEDFYGFMVDQIRRFKPLVAVTHDLNGEYGHGTHCLAARALMEASELCTDELFRPESVQEYGVWSPEKVYLHCYEENPITLDWDIPLDSFGGKTAFQMSQEAFLCHESQQIFPRFTNWIFGSSNERTRAKEIELYSPCEYGLYKTAVGADTEGGDFFENVKTYAEQEAENLQKAEEERRKAEEERIKEEERIRAEKERIRAEEIRKEQERIRAEEEQRIAEAARLAREESRRRITIIAAGTAAVGAAAIAAALICNSVRKRRRKR